MSRITNIVHTVGCNGRSVQKYPEVAHTWRILIISRGASCISPNTAFNPTAHRTITKLLQYRTI